MSVSKVVDERETAAQVLDLAAGYLLTGWCQGCQAQTVGGRSVPPSSHEAVKWCAGGAIQRAALSIGGEDWRALANSAALRANGVARYRSMVAVNDGAETVGEVLDVLAEAAARLRREVDSERREAGR